MSSVNWNDMSLSQLKDIVAHINGSMFGQLRTSAAHFQQAATALETAESQLSTQMGVLRDGWQGKAASAAVTNAQQNRASMNQTRTSSTSAHSDTDSYLSRLESDQKQANAIQNVDTSLGHALLTGGWAGPVGVGVAAVQAHQQYNKNHDAMVKVVQRMDTDGQDHADQMKSMGWSTQMNTGMGAPPRTLPPVPGSQASEGGGGSPGGYPGGGGTTSGGTGPGYTPVMTGPAMTGEDGNIINGPRGNHPGAGDPTETQSGPTKTPNDPTISQSGPGAVTTPGTGSGPTVGPAPTTTGASGITGAGAVGGVIGGAGLIGGATGGGLLGGTGVRGGSVAEGETPGRLPRGGSGIAEGEGEPRLGGVRGGTALGEGGSGEPGLGMRGSGGIGGSDPEPGLRGGVRPGGNGALGEGEGELGAPRGSALAGARPTGFAGEPVAGEAGRMGGYPMGGMGGRRGGDDEEAPMPDYLVETDDVWGDGVTAAPPVIGE